MSTAAAALRATVLAAQASAAIVAENYPGPGRLAAAAAAALAAAIEHCHVLADVEAAARAGRWTMSHAAPLYAVMDLAQGAQATGRAAPMRMSVAALAVVSDLVAELADLGGDPVEYQLPHDVSLAVQDAAYLSARLRAALDVLDRQRREAREARRGAATTT